MTRPGIASSEFWGGLAVPLAGAVALMREYPDVPTRVAVIAGGTCVACCYILGRSFAKGRRL